MISACTKIGTPGKDSDDPGPSCTRFLVLEFLCGIFFLRNLVREMFDFDIWIHFESHVHLKLETCRKHVRKGSRKGKLQVVERQRFFFKGKKLAGSGHNF